MLAIDWTHMGRRDSGIERVTRELFGQQMLAGIPARRVGAGGGRFGRLATQTLLLPAQSLLRPSDVFLFPGFPPSPLFALFRERCILYVHDLFLLLRRGDLNFAGKYYMAPSFLIAVKRLKYFFANSEQTAAVLRGYCAPDASVMIYRPRVRNVFGLAVGDRAERPDRPDTLKLVAVGTIEPRKNLPAAADLAQALERRLGCSVELHLVGRAGWGPDHAALAAHPNVVLHGPLDDAQARDVVQAADLCVSTSHDEGLGLPLLEVQHGGLPVIAPDRPIFHEVLGRSGIYIDPADAEASAGIVEGVLRESGWRARSIALGEANVRRWNEAADLDHRAATSFMRDLLAPNPSQEPLKQQS